MMLFRKFKRTAIGVLMIASASFCLAVAALWTLHSYRLITTALRTAGHITQLIERSGDHGESFYPVFTYADRNSIQHTIYSNVGTYPPSHQVGDAVTVLYSPGAEGNAQLDDWFDIWGVPTILASLGIVHLSVGIITCAWPRIVERWQTRTS